MSKRFNNLSLYRLIATILVFIFHLFYLVPNYDNQYTLLLSAGVQGLLALSGMLYSQKEITDKKEFYKNNLVKILVPAAISIILILIWNVVNYLIAPYKFDNNFLTTFYSFRPANGELQIQIGNFWFIPAILGCYLITPCLQKATSTDKLNFSKIFLVIVVVAELILTISFYLTNAFIAYILGYLLGRKSFEKHVNPNSEGKINRMLFYLFLMVMSFTIYYFSIESGYLSSEILGIKLLARTLKRYSCSFFGIFSFLFLIMISINLNKLKDQPGLLKFSDKHAYAFYLFNQTFFVGAMNVSGMANMLVIQGVIVSHFVLIYAILTTNISIPLIDLFLKKKKIG